MQAGSVVREVINAQPDAWTRVLASSQVQWDLPGRVLCVGSGTSYYLALVVAALGQRLGLDITAIPAQNIILDAEEAVTGFDSVIVISRSGETSEAIWSARIAKKQGKVVLGVTCNDAAPLLQTVDRAWILDYAHDHTVVMVRSFTSMLMAFEQALARHGQNAAGLAALEGLVGHAQEFVAQAGEIVRAMMERTPRRVYILGAGVRHGIALEGALKCLEMSNENAAAYGPLEFRHGPWGSVTDDDVVVLLGQTRYASHEREVLRDLSERTQRLLTVASPEWFRGNDDPGIHLLLPDLDDLWLGPLAVVPLQWLGYDWAIKTGRDPDAPKNLTQVVDLSYGIH
ncbi:MAG: sugar isomerase [Sulfobacillus acidophilus]|uniref:Sugar isomerase n=1 Tax=Sulfobacillus acidophilus TaxID=53633 RepID=A0A2T2WJG9_9FIRM|nr:MAG: sugar isomerase [Sulfobacillus acidophilus]